MSSVNILIIDNSEENISELSRILGHLPCHIIASTSGRDALNHILEKEFALILLNVMMPESHGYELVHRIKKVKNGFHAPIILFSSEFREKEDILEGYRTGAVDYILMPVELLILVNKVNVFIELFKQKKVAENAIQKIKSSEQKYRSLFDTSRDGIAFISMEGYIEDANPAFCEMVGWGISELRFLNYRNYTPEKGVHFYDEIIESQVLVRGYSDEFKNELLKKDNTRIPVVVRLWLVRDDKGAPLRMLKILRDITRQTQLEAQLRQSQKMESIGTLAGGIAHDFNNILGAIMGYVQLAQLNVKDESATRHNLDNVLIACNRAKDLVAHILTFSRQSETVRKPVRIHRVVTEALKLIRASLPSTIEIHQEIEKDSTLVNTDPTEIHQIIMNFCTNALHAMEGKGGILSVSLKPVEIDQISAMTIKDIVPGPYLKLTVSDTGCGIEKNALERIFDPYYTTKKMDEGTGLGLAVVHGIVKAHDGFINVQSDLGRGTTFEVFFPRIKAEDTLVEIRKTEIQKGTERILFVDDEQALVDLEKVMLQRLGYHVVSESSSVMALKLFEETPDAFDLVITDMTMPKMTGDELSRRILSIRQDIPIILCTGYSHQISPEKARDVGIRELLYKPIEIRELASAIRRVLAGT
ncbi:MAG: response regulator [Proteobacteria bacterium]|nr:response regulator [Pseudomonadota bacterium]